MFGTVNIREYDSNATHLQSFANDYALKKEQSRPKEL